MKMTPSDLGKRGYRAALKKYPDLPHKAAKALKNQRGIEYFKKLSALGVAARLRKKASAVE